MPRSNAHHALKQKYGYIGFCYSQRIVLSSLIVLGVYVCRLTPEMDDSEGAFDVSVSLQKYRSAFGRTRKKKGKFMVKPTQYYFALYVSFGCILYSA